MEGVREFLEHLRREDLVAGEFLGLLHLVIGRRIAKADGTVLSTGLTWRALSNLLKQMRWDKEAVRELGLDPADLPPRDRQRYWYAAITQARVDSAAAREAGDRLAEKAAALGYVIGPAPGGRPDAAG